MLQTQCVTAWCQLVRISEQVIDGTITFSNSCSSPGTSEALRELISP